MIQHGSARHIHALTSEERQRQKKVREDEKKQQMLDMKHQHDAERLFSENDAGKKGYLEKSEVKTLLHQAVHHTPKQPKPAEPTDEELNFVMVSTLHSEPDPNTAKFTQLHVLSALEIWKTYLKNKTKISGWVDKYDGNHTGKLNIEEFKHLIHDLKHGEEYTATDEDIAKCFHDASLRPENEKNDMELKTTELMGALTLWYSEEGKRVAEQLTQVEAEVDAAIAEGGSAPPELLDRFSSLEEHKKHNAVNFTQFKLEYSAKLSLNAHDIVKPPEEKPQTDFGRATSASPKANVSPGKLPTLGEDTPPGKSSCCSIS